MLEKTIILENVSLVDFLGVRNQQIKTLSEAFPTCKIISRGHEIRINGPTSLTTQIYTIVDSLLQHYHKFGKVSNHQLKDLIEKKDIPTFQSNKVLFYGIHGKEIIPKTVTQGKLVDVVAKNQLVFAVGPAGTGKTYIAVALAMQALKNKLVKKIIITRPAVEAGESLGFLPGNLDEKINPYLKPIDDALKGMVTLEKLKFYKEKGIIEIAPLAYMRGRTLEDAFVILDEAQNTTPMQIKMFLTRIGIGSKMVITGDISQIDLSIKEKSGLIASMNILKSVKGIGFVNLDASDVVRHPLVKEIIKAYNNYGLQSNTGNNT